MGCDAFPEIGCGSGDAASSGCLLPSVGSRLPAPGAGEKRLLGVERICLDQHATQIQLTKQLLLLRRSLRLETARSWFSPVA